MGQNLLAGKIVYKGDEQIDMDHREDEGEQKLYLNKLERKFQTEVRYLKYVDYAVSFRRGIFLQMEHLAKAIEEGDASLYEPIIIR